jgi:VanZ family protein
MMPPWVVELLGREAPVWSAAFLAGLVLWMGAVAAWVAEQVLKRPLLALGAPLLAAGAGAIGWFLLRAASAGSPWSAGAAGEHTGRTILLLAAAVLILVLAGEVVGAVRTMRWEQAAGCIGFLFLISVPWMVLARLILGDAAGTRFIRTGRVPGDLLLGLVVFLVGLSAAAVGRALSRPRLGCVLLAGGIAALLVVPGWFMAMVALVPRVPYGGEAVPPLRVLLSGDPAADLSALSLLARWGLLQLGAVLLLGMGHLVGLWLAGRREREAAAEGAGRAEPAGLARPGGPAAPPPWHAGRTCAVLAAAGLVLTVYGSLVPLEFREVPFDQALKGFLEMPYLELGIENRADLVANLVVFLPLGFLAMGALTRGGTRGGRWLIGACVVLGLWALAAGIEFVQAYFPPRTVSLNDVLAEAAGAAAGVGLWLAFGRRATEWLRDLREGRDPRRLAVLVLGGYALALFVYQLFPFDVVITRAELVRDLQSAKVSPVPFAGAGGLSATGLAAKGGAFVPVGYLIVAAWTGRRRPLAAAAGLGLLFAAAIEVLQVFVHSRYASGTDVAAGMAGAGFGGWLATRFGPAAVRPFPRGGFWRAAGAAAKAGLLLGGMAAVLWAKWQPLEYRWPPDGLGQALRAMLRVPFYHQYWNTEFEATAQLAADVGSAALLGLVWGSLLKRLGRPGLVTAAALAGVFGAAAEAGQVFFPPHVPDLTTVVLAGAGGAAGALLYRPFARTFLETPRQEEAGGWLTT